MSADPTALAWFALAAANVIAVAMSVASVRRQRRARTVLTAASLDHAMTVRRLGAEARDVIDQHLAETPIYAETCAAEARRIAEAELDADLRRPFDGSAS